jgi:hypothetical protein
VLKSTVGANVTEGNAGTALMPGSTQVWDRTSGQLVPCTPQLCSDIIVRNGTPVYINRHVACLCTAHQLSSLFPRQCCLPDAHIGLLTVSVKHCSAAKPLASKAH